MLGNRAEYDKMAAAETTHWWYTTLHGQVLKNLQRHFNFKKDIALLDAGCGTGGLMLYLKQQGYTNTQGFDISDDALTHCRKRNLMVSRLGLQQVGDFYKPQSVDAIICCDALYFLDFEQQQKVLQYFAAMLKPKGLLLLNLPALDVFSGTHDISVGIKKRYHHAMLYQLLPAHLGLSSITFRYWPVAVSPVIALARARQRKKMNERASSAVSDVSLPGLAVNTLLKVILATEMQLPPVINFGSSLFVEVIKK
ncbi:MAG TPA: class I SAM-dependent methyltransferase [Chitinophagales bacterium]|nr:class I SAM-dependent methyltransferase [Chitinophagales bacterium]